MHVHPSQELLDCGRANLEAEEQVARSYAPPPWDFAARTPQETKVSHLPRRPLIPTCLDVHAIPCLQQPRHAPTRAYRSTRSDACKEWPGALRCTCNSSGPAGLWRACKGSPHRGLLR